VIVLLLNFLLLLFPYGFRSATTLKIHVSFFKEKLFFSKMIMFLFEKKCYGQVIEHKLLKYEYVPFLEHLYNPKSI